MTPPNHFSPLADPNPQVCRTKLSAKLGEARLPKSLPSPGSLAASMIVQGWAREASCRKSKSHLSVRWQPNEDSFCTDAQETAYVPSKASSELRSRRSWILGAGAVGKDGRGCRGRQGVHCWQGCCALSWPARQSKHGRELALPSQTQRNPPMRCSRRSKREARRARTSERTLIQGSYTAWTAGVLVDQPLEPSKGARQAKSDAHQERRHVITPYSHDPRSKSRRPGSGEGREGSGVRTPPSKES